MGFYHIGRTGKGIYIDKFDIDKIAQTIPDEWIPTEEWLNKHYPDSVGGYYGKLSKEHKLFYLGQFPIMNYLFWGPDKITELTEARLIELCGDENERKWAYLKSLANIFSFIHGYPVRCFVSLADYDDTWMFYSILKFPPDEYSVALASLTTEIYRQQLTSFMSTVTGTPKEYEIELCEEYVKD